MNRLPRAIKRGFDIIVATVSLLCVAPLLLVSMMCIVLESPGSPLFLQERVGRSGRVFRIFKLRTMHVGAEKFAASTAVDDPRVTGVGSVLRRLKFDELPQLVNVLRGEMSLIGPRPLPIRLIESLIENDGFGRDYPGLVPTFRPGLIGLEQVNRDRERTFAERFALNHEYEQNWSLRSDCKILMRGIYQCSPVCIAVCCGALVLCWLLV